MKKGIDDNIKERMNQNIDVNKSDTDEMWDAIEGKLERPNAAPRNSKSFFRSKPFMSFYTTAAAALMLFIGAQTEEGSALVDKLKANFEPEKEVAVSIEGMQEMRTMSIPATRSFATDQVKEKKYVLYIDEERYKLIENGEVDRIVPTETLSENYPDVFMEIKRVSDQNPEQTAAFYNGLLNSTYDEVKDVIEVSEPIKGYMVQNIPLGEWDSVIERHYALSDGQGGTYVITMKYFLEAAEGHGARFEQMLKEFYVLGSENEEVLTTEEESSAEGSQVSVKSVYLEKLNNTKVAVEALVATDTSTYALKEVESKRWEMWDGLLNDIYSELREKLTVAEMEQLKMEQRTWLEFRDTTALEASEKFKGGTQEHLEYVAVLANLTEERSYFLVEEYMN